MAEGFLGGLLGGIGDAAQGVGSGLAGLLGGGQTGGPSSADPYSQMSPEEQRRMSYSALGQLGAILLAAGQRQTPAQRGQILSQLGGIGPGMEQQIARSAQLRGQQADAAQRRELFPLQRQQMMGTLEQQRLAQQKAQLDIEGEPLRREQVMGTLAQQRLTQEQLMREMEQRKSLQQMMSDPEVLRKLNITPELAKIIGPEGISSIAQRRALVTPEAQEAAALDLQIKRDQAAGGKFMTVGGQAYKITPEGLVPAVPAPTWASQQPQAQNAPPALQAPAASWSDGGGPPPQERPPGSINPTLDYSRAFGSSGFLNRNLGTAQGATFGETASTAAATKAISEVNILKNGVINALTADVPGRSLKMTQERVASLFPNPGELFTSQQDATNKLSGIKNLIDSEISNLEAVVKSTGTYSAPDKAKADQAILDLRRNRDNIDTRVRNLERGGPSEKVPQSGTTQSGVSWRIK